MSPVASSAPTLEISRRQPISLYCSLGTILMTLYKEYPKIMIVKIIFIFFIVKLDKPVIGSLIPKMKDLEELLVTTSFPLNSTRW